MPFHEMTIDAFLGVLSDKSAVPGGGGASALVGAIAASLAHMVASLTVGKAKYAAFDEEMRDLQRSATDMRERFLRLMDEDASAFAPLAEAYRLPKETPEQQRIRADVMERALDSAVQPPLIILEACLDALALTETCALHGSVMAVSDAGVSAALLRAASEGAYENVIINTQSMRARDKAEALNRRAELLVNTCAAKADELTGLVREKLRA